MGTMMTEVCDPRLPHNSSKLHVQKERGTETSTAQTIAPPAQFGIPSAHDLITLRGTFSLIYDILALHVPL
jgi:hypothetical protein